MKILYRPGERQDCTRIAQLNNIASGGAVEFLFHDLIPGMSPEQIVASNLENERIPHSYQNTIVAECNKKIIGMSLSFPGKFHGLTDEMIDFFPKDRIHHFRHFFNAPVHDSYFLDAICVDAEFRKKNIGGTLIDLTKALAVKKGFDSLCLIVFKDNVDAQKVYQKNGFKIIDRIDLQPHALMPHEGGCILMKAVIG